MPHEACICRHAGRARIVRDFVVSETLQAYPEFPPTAPLLLLSLRAGQRCWVGTGSGQLEVLDLRTLKMAGGVRGIAGQSVLSQCHRSTACAILLAAAAPLGCRWCAILPMRSWLLGLALCVLAHNGPVQGTGR